MALSVSPQANPIGSYLVLQTETNNDLNDQTNVTGAPGEMITVEIDNTGNPLEKVYLKIYDNLSPVVAVTPPDWIFPCDAGEKKDFVMPNGSVYANGLSFSCVTTPGTSGNVSPTNPVIVRIVGK